MAIEDYQSMDADYTRATRSYAHELFAEFAVRILAALLDAAFALFLIRNGLVSIFGAGHNIPDTATFVVLVPYCTLFWSSPMGATPVQYLLGMRVVDESGKTLKFLESMQRSVVLIGLLAGALYVLTFRAAPYLSYLAIAPLALLCLGTFTPHRQSAHDLLAGSIVVNRKATKTTEQRARMREFLADKDPDSRRRRRQPIYRMVIDAIVLAAPVFLVTTMIQIDNDRNVRGRVGYALSNVSDLKAHVSEYYSDAARWPSGQAGVGTPIRGTYPDGGGFQLENRGIIRIYFTVDPALVDVSILLRPTEDHAHNVVWDCFYEGEIVPALLPAVCREELDPEIAMAWRD